MPASPAKFKKKIAELLRAALAESAELSAAFQVERKAPEKKKEQAAPAEVEKTERFGAGSPEFQNALRALPEDLLALIDRQFGVAPAALSVTTLKADETPEEDSETGFSGAEAPLSDDEIDPDSD